MLFRSHPEADSLGAQQLPHTRSFPSALLPSRDVCIFEDENGKMNRNLESAGGAILAVSQFTLLADCRSRRPAFTAAARPETAVPLYAMFQSECRARGFRVEHGVFGADMAVSSVNDGPVTILLDSRMR